MAELGDLVEKVRSKNAGPFWVTVDIFCGSEAVFRRVAEGLSDARVAKALGTPPEALRRFEIGSLNVVKFSCPRPVVQGTRFDRDMHGAGWGALIAELEVN